MVRNTLHLDLHILELQDRQQRLTLRGLLNEEHPISIHGLDGEELEASSLRETLLSFDDERESEELDLVELSTISGGVGLPEALVSSTILMVMVSQSSGLFADSMGGLSKSRLRDGLNASIAADIELVRDQVLNFRSSQASGQLSFEDRTLQRSRSILKTQKNALADMIMSLFIPRTVSRVYGLRFI